MAVDADEGAIAQLLSSLSPQLGSVWAKSGSEDNQLFSLWLPLVGHAMDAAGIMGHLWDEWVPPQQQRAIARPFSGCQAETSAQTFLQYLAAVHDVGKISKPFAAQVPVFADQMRQLGLAMPGNASPEYKSLRHLKHGLVGEVIVERFRADLGMTPPVMKAVGSIVGSHHGMTVAALEKESPAAETSQWGNFDPEGPWSLAQKEFLRFAAAYTGAEELLGQTLVFSQQELALMSGLVIVADWLASSTDLFPLTRVNDRYFGYLRRDGGQNERVLRAWEDAALPPRWHPQLPEDDAAKLFHSRFDLPVGAEPRPLQVAAFREARAATTPTLLIIEDAMGAGKTEAALLAAETLASVTGASGIIFALPTQATTDAMFDRVLRYLEAEKNTTQTEESTLRAVSLLHGKSQWNPHNRELARAGRSYLENVHLQWEIPLTEGQIGIDESGSSDDMLIAHPWFTGRKKAVLSSFVTSTIDHVLFGALKTKHLVLRHVGLSQKVVVIDEAHASSEFMNHYAVRVLEWLGAYGVPVVILSATLHRRLRERLTSAYRKGLATWTPVAEEDPASGTEFYPRLTVANPAGVEEKPISAASQPQQITLRGHSVDEDTADFVLHLARNREGCILVIANTVKSAQALYLRLREELGEDVRLFHSRFTVDDRLRNDEWLRNTFGPKAERPHFSVVISTQVAEQSLDVDFDVLVTELAPVDLILQRIGRMHRHRRESRPAEFTLPTCHIMGMPRFEVAPELDKGSCSVYGAYRLLRSALVIGAEAFEDRGAQATLPGQIGAMVEAADSKDFAVPPAWEEFYEAAQEKQEVEDKKAADGARGFLLGSPKRPRPRATLDRLLDFSGDEEASDINVRAKVRDGDEGIEVILTLLVGGEYYSLPTDRNPEGVVIPTDTVPSSAQANALARGTLRLPASLTMKNPERVIKELEQWCPLPWEEHPLLRGQLYLPLEDGCTTIDGKQFRYSKEMGLEEIHERD